MKDVFFLATQHAIDNLTEVFDLVHPILASYWNMKSEITGLKNLYPSISEAKLKSRYSIAPDTRGVNYTRSFLDWDWEKIKDGLAWVLLNNIFVVYEGWLKELHNNVFSDTHGCLNTSNMQFPKDPTGTNVNRNILDEIFRLTQDESIMLKDSFYDLYRTRSRRATVPLNNLMYCYRLFKEYRNCYTHNGLLASSTLISAYNDFLPYAYASALGVKECPEYAPPVLGRKVCMKLRGVIGFSYIAIQIILTCDAELLRSKYAESEFLSRLQYMNKIKYNVRRDNSGAGTAKVYVQGAGYLKPTNANLLCDYLFDNGLFFL